MQDAAAVGDGDNGGDSIAIPSSVGAIVRFFVITFAISWGMGGLCVWWFGQPGYVIGKSTTNPLFFLSFGFGPAFGAFATIAITGEPGAARDVLRRMVLWRVGLKWYAVIVLGALAIGLAQGAIVWLAGGQRIRRTRLLRARAPAGFISDSGAYR